MSDILDKRLVFVTGKGGVGKTTVAAALGLVAARAGKRAIVCEVAQQERMSRVFEREGVGFSETRLATDLYAISIDPQRSMEEYLRHQIKPSQLYGVLFDNRLFQYFAAATPGMRELATIGKVWELAQFERRNPHAAPYDVVIVDAPSTGHGLGFLRTPRTFRDAARVGAISRQAGKIDSFITDPDSTGVVAVALPEEMPVNETVDFERDLHAEMGIELDAVVVNALYPERFDDDEADRIEEAASANGSAGVEAALKAALFEHHRGRTQRAELRRLSRELGHDPITLPFLFEPELDLDSFEELADELEAAL
ncbi:MAG TPA: ArsA-related P-loop ATPase [Thermoleophilaceae bacterium]|jgi:anion-transporting  ArsA/GET3 family ATPase